MFSNSIELELCARIVSWKETLRAMREFLDPLGGRGVVGYTIDLGEDQDGDEALAVRAITPDTHDVALDWSFSSGMHLIQLSGSSVYRRVEISTKITVEGEAIVQARRDVVSTWETVLARWSVDPRLIRASITPKWSEHNCLPSVPVANYSTYLIERRPYIGESYEGDEFFTSGWDDVKEAQPDVFVCKRATGVFDRVGLRAAIQDQQWALWRLAPPGRGRIWLGPMPDDELAVHRRGPDRLEIVGYLPNQQTLEMSCVLPPGGHVQPWEICDLAHIKSEGCLPDGRAVRVVRVVFFHCEQALQERRPLLELGIDVHYLGPTGELVEVTQ